MHGFPTIITAGLALGVVAAVPSPAGAQALEVSVNGGVATDQAGARSNALTVAPSLSFSGDHTSLGLGAAMMRFANHAWSVGASALLRGRTDVGRFVAMTLDAGAGATRFNGSTHATFLEGSLTPALEASIGRVTLFGGARLATGVTRQQPSQPIPFRPAARPIQTSVSGGGPVYGGAITLVEGPTGNARLAAREDRLRVGGQTIVDRAFELGARHERVRFAAAAGVREMSGSRTSFGSGSLSFAIGATGSTLELAAGRYAANPFIGTPGGRFASVGITFREQRDVNHAPDVPGAPPPPPGTTRLAIRAPDVRVVQVAGDFNDWTLVRATRAGDGFWFVDLRIPPGNYRYAFRINGSDWRVPDGAAAVDDGFGGKSAWLSVDEGGSSR